MQDLPSRKEIDEILGEDNKFKKIIISIVSIFLLLLITSYFLMGYPIFQIIAGNYESHELIGNTIFTEEYSIVFLHGEYNKLITHYLDNEEVEISACLRGYKENNYFIEEVYFPEIIYQDVNRVEFKACPTETLIWLHSHPYKRCIASSQDIKTLKIKKDNFEEALMMIMCSTTQFNIYG